ncbi:predicted esterase [Chthonomonas calidirosea]|uniref:Predicted esterase n=1 Tax=Chthonomonas calidirosea (strain DSM 23976 / ICMP 18418 / T49) TaxID=1303518 RepID=S0EWG1_CHTCT|nr:alpha/beta hydrolase family protein [Chthonomonas calidirosea]CCW34038.1 Predicted esterase [Chthonomonas calidirosea T49]CEK15934.1 predicted esterase [Chthonomonas calidirosea]
MAFCELKYFSPALQKQTAANIILPEGKKGPFSVLYLLHGLSDDHTIWHRRTSIERYVQDLPLIVVMPDNGRGWYTDAVEGPASETAIVLDLMNLVDSLFPTRAERAGRCVAGLSMGGYGAFKLALKYPNKFCAAVSHSGALGIGHFPLRPEEVDSVGDDANLEERRRWMREMVRIFGEDPVGSTNDLYALAKQVPQSLRPALRFDCGTEDFLLDQNRSFHSYLAEIGYPHQYEEFPGGHDWSYWDRHVQETLQFFRPILSLDQV